MHTEFDSFVFIDIDNILFVILIFIEVVYIPLDLFMKECLYLWAGTNGSERLAFMGTAFSNSWLPR